MNCKLCEKEIKKDICGFCLSCIRSYGINKCVEITIEKTKKKQLENKNKEIVGE